MTISLPEAYRQVGSSISRVATTAMPPRNWRCRPLGFEGQHIPVGPFGLRHADEAGAMQGAAL